MMGKFHRKNKKKDTHFVSKRVYVGNASFLLLSLSLSDSYQENK